MRAGRWALVRLARFPMDADTERARNEGLARVDAGGKACQRLRPGAWSHWWSTRANSTNRDSLNNFCERRSRVLNSRFAALLDKTGVEFTTSGRCDASPLFSSPPLGVSFEPETASS